MLRLDGRREGQGEKTRIKEEGVVEVGQSLRTVFLIVLLLM